MEGESESSKYNSYTLSLATVRASTNGAKNNGELPKVVGFQRMILFVSEKISNPTYLTTQVVVLVVRIEL